jgi:hypothetical protein
MKINRCRLAISLLMALSFRAQAAEPLPPPPILKMPGSSRPLAEIKLPKTLVFGKTSSAASTVPSVQMKILVLAGTSDEYSYLAIKEFLTDLGVPYTGVAVNTLTPDGQGNRLSGFPLVDTATGQGLYQGIIETNSNFSVCDPTCRTLLSTTDLTTLDNYASQFGVRVVSYYTWPEAKWGLSPNNGGSGHSSSNPLQVTVTAAGASVFSYINTANAIPVAGSGDGSIWAYQATPVAAAGETTTPILKAGNATVGVTHTTADGRESLSLTFDNYPSLLHSLAFSYGVINWVTKGIFLGARQIYLNPQNDDILLGDRLYAPTLPQCPNDPACPDVEMTSADLVALRNWQNNHRADPQFSTLRTTFSFVGSGASFGPQYAQEAQTMTEQAFDYGWVNHGFVHADGDCFTTSPGGTCIPATLQQSLAEFQKNQAFATSIGLIPADHTGLVTPFNNGLGNQAYLQAAAWLGITSVISPANPPTPNAGSFSTVVPSLYLIPRRVTNLLWDVNSPQTGVFGSLPDEYNSLYGPNGSTPFFPVDQTYSQIIDNESTDLLLLRMLPYEPYPLAFHTANSVTYDGAHSLMTDLLDATIQKYKRLYNLPVYTLQAMRDIAPLLRARETYNASGVTGVYTPGVSVVLKTVNAATIPMTGACSQAVCPRYGGQMQDYVSMAAGSTVTLSLSAGVGQGLSTVSANPTSMGSLSQSTGVVALNGIATSSVLVSLTSNNPAAVVPSSVTIAAGDMGASFRITAGSVSSPVSATITATLNGVSKSTTVTVNPAIALSGLTLSPSTVSGGGSSQGTVTLSSAAPAGGIVISFVSNNNAATVPASVTIPQGSSSATFNVSTSAVTGTTIGDIVAIYNYVIRTAPLTVTAGSAVTLSDVSVNPSQVIGGTSSQGTVTLSGPAPAGGINVTLGSNSAATVPSSVTVSAGNATATFTVTTTSVSSATNATISASYNGVTRTAFLTITPSVALTSVSLNPASVVGGAGSTGTVTLNGLAPAGGSTVALSSNNSSATVPASVSVAAGQNSATFAVTTSTVTSTATATISGVLNGVTKTAALTITPPAALSGVSLNPASVVGGSGSTGTVTLTSAAPAGGITVTLSSNSSSATVAASVGVAAGQTSATFPVTTLPVTVTATATITAAYSGVTKTAALTINPPAAVALSTLTVSPNSVAGGATSTGTATLAANAPTGGVVVTLSSNSTAATVPPSVTVAAGSKTATFTVTTTGVSALTNAVLTGSAGGVQKTASLEVRPPLYTTFTVAPASVGGGTPSAGTVQFAGVAPAGGLVVTLSSNNPLAGVPASVTVPAGSSSATFPITTKAANYTAKPSITGTFQGTAISDTLTIIGLTSVAVSPRSVQGGKTSTGTVRLTGAAPAGGVVVALSSSSTSAIVPATVTVAAGSSSKTFTINTTAVAATTTATINATLGGLTTSTTLTMTH